MNARFDFRKAIGIAAAASMLIAFAAIVSVAGITRYTNPSLTLKVAPWDAVANAVIADRDIQAQPLSVSTASVADHAKAALARSPLSPVGLRVLGFIAEIEGKPALARMRLEASAELSRRDLGTQLWLINAAVARNDVQGALGNFDTAMRTSQPGRVILFPILASALADPEFRRPIADLLSKQPNWAHDFIVVTLQSGEASDAVADILPRIRVGPAKQADDLSQMAVDQLVREQKFTQARRLFSRTYDGVPPTTAVFDPGLTGKRGLVPFAWTFATDGALGAEPAARGINYSADRGRSGEAASQVLTLPPGRYVLSVTGARSGDGSAVWSISCANVPSVKIGRIDLSDRQGPKTKGQAFIVPAAECAGQTLRLELDANEGGAGISGSVAQVAVAPAAL